LYEGCNNKEPRTYRGQTGAQDDTIPTLDIFTGVYNYYPKNELTKYLYDLRPYRPVIVQQFLEDLAKHTLDYKTLSDDSKKILYEILIEIYNFRNGHWQFVQKYILANTKYATATGGTPITTWIPNQIGAVLTYMTDVLNSIEDGNYIQTQIEKLDHRKQILAKQQDLLKDPNYQPSVVYQVGDEFNEN
jgi:indoleamine 2,3-dioxygenase